MKKRPATMSHKERRKLIEKPFPAIVTVSTGKAWAGISRYGAHRYSAPDDYFEKDVTKYEDTRY